ncbi:MAG: TrpR-like protein YerC/YecD [Clostridia bacterium]|nr:TrpR-like protein YerC/YecD [Clostridia bacterium]
MYEPKVRSEQIDLLMKAVLELETLEDAYRFFEDVCTIQELKSIAQRIEVAVLLRKKVTYQEIARLTGASTATISRVNRAVNYGADGYTRVLDALDRQHLLDEIQ